VRLEVIGQLKKSTSSGTRSIVSQPTAVPPLVRGPRYIPPLYDATQQGSVAGPLCTRMLEVHGGSRGLWRAVVNKVMNLRGLINVELLSNC
jgi:hypothetical protein